MNTKILSATESKVAAGILSSGGLVAIPTETVYGLAANALDPVAVKNIYIAKGRPSDNPLIVHISSIEEWRPLVTEIPDKALKLANAFWPGPLTIILPKSNIIPPETSGGLDTVAVRMPSNPIARKIIAESGVPLAAPSANVSGLPSPTAFEHVFDDMNGKIDAIVDGGECAVGVESTVITLATDVPRILRPGGITAEQIRSVIGEVQIDDAVLNPLKKGEKAASPGMMYKHYSPKAEITVVKGSLDEFMSYVKRHTDEGTAVLCFENEEEKFTCPCVTMGMENDGLSQAGRLFNALRELDEIGARTVYSRSPSQDGVGLAVCNRLYRAAGFRIVKAVPVIGLTGKTGAGKSTIGKILREKGCEIIDCDQISRDITNPGSPVLAELAKEFGDDVVVGGVLNRQKLADRAFRDDESTARLNAITHPAIFKEIYSQIARAKSSLTPAVLDAPLLFEGGLDKLCDFTVSVLADEEVRLKRIMKRDSISPEQAKMRMDRQKLDDEFYRSHSTYIVVNNNDDSYLIDTEKIPV